MPAARAILRSGKRHDPFVETPDAMVARVLRAFVGDREQVVGRSRDWTAMLRSYEPVGSTAAVSFVTRKRHIEVREKLGNAIEALYADAPIAGDPDLLDDRGRHRVA